MKDTAYWDHIASDYDSLYVTSWSLREDADVASRLRLLWDSALESVPRPLHVDVGAGTGLGQRLVGSTPYVGIDFSSAMVRRVRTGWPVQADFDAGLPVRDQTCDLATALYAAASYSNDLGRLASEMYRILRPDGWLYMSVLSRWSLRRLARLDVRRKEAFATRNSVPEGRLPIVTCYSAGEVQRILEKAGFRDVTTVGLGAFGGVAEVPALYRVSRWLGARVPSCSHLLETVARR